MFSCIPIGEFLRSLRGLNLIQIPARIHKRLLKAIFRQIRYKQNSFLVYDVESGPSALLMATIIHKKLSSLT